MVLTNSENHFTDVELSARKVNGFFLKVKISN